MIYHVMNLILLTILATHYPIIIFILITIYQITHPINIITPIIYFIINYHFQSFTNLIDQSILFNNPPIIFNLFQLEPDPKDEIEAEPVESLEKVKFVLNYKVYDESV